MSEESQWMRQNVLLAVLSVFFVVLLVIGVDRVMAIVGLLAAAFLTVVVTRHRRRVRAGR